MLFNQLIYYKYQLLCNKKLCPKSAIETLYAIKKRLKATDTISFDASQKITTTNSWFGKSVQHIFKHYGKPEAFKTFKHGSVHHQVVKYNRVLKNITTEIEYHFVHQNMASGLFNFSVKDANELATINHYIETTFLSNQGIDARCFDIIDGHGNKIKYEQMDTCVKLYFLNHNMEVLQNINSALFQQNFQPLKIASKKQFQFSV